MTTSHPSEMNCLVTGGAGFVGSHLVDALVSAGHRVTVLDNLSTGKRANIAQHGSLVSLIKADIRDLGALNEACQGQDVIFHKAAIASVAESVRDPKTTYEVNILGTGNLFEAAGKAGVKHLVFASSAAVYGPAEVSECHEALPPQAASQYGLSKLVGEQYGRFYSDFNSMQVTCLRYFNIYGPRQNPQSDYAGVISLFINKALTNQTLTIYGDGLQTRDFVNVADVVQANLRALSQTGQYHFEVINVGTGNSISVLDLVETLRSLGFDALTVQHQPERRGELRHSRSNINKARELLGFEPTMLFKKGLWQVVETMRSPSTTDTNGLQAGEPLVYHSDQACNA